MYNNNKILQNKIILHSLIVLSLFVALLGYSQNPTSAQIAQKTAKNTNFTQASGNKLNIRINQTGVKKWKTKVVYKNNIVSKTIVSKKTGLNWTIKNKKTLETIWVKTIGKIKTKFSKWTKVYETTIPNKTTTDDPSQNNDPADCQQAVEQNDEKWLGEHCGWFPTDDKGSWLFPTRNLCFSGKGEQWKKDECAYGETRKSVEIHATGKTTSCVWTTDTMVTAEVEWTIPVPDKYFKDLGRVDVREGGVIPGATKQYLDNALKVFEGKTPDLENPYKSIKDTLSNKPVVGNVAHPTTRHTLEYDGDSSPKFLFGTPGIVEYDGSVNGGWIGNTEDETYSLDTRGYLLTWATVATEKRDANFDQKMLGLEDGSRVGAIGSHPQPWDHPQNIYDFVYNSHISIVTEPISLDPSACER